MNLSFIEILKVIFLGIVEGITEWLPISRHRTHAFSGRIFTAKRK